MLTVEVREFTRPKNSSMIFGGCPAAGITEGAEISFAIMRNYSQKQRGAIDFFSNRKLDSPDGKIPSNHKGRKEHEVQD